jgi:hypothetical protein
VVSDHEGDGAGTTAAGPASLTASPFVVGYRRSGLQLVRALCDSHPGLTVVPESHYAVSLLPGGADQRFEVQRFVEALHTSQQLRDWGPSPADVERSLAVDPPEDYADAVRRVFSLGAASCGTLGFGVLAPDHLAQIELLAQMFPEARIVHVLRDGRDVAASLVELGQAASVDLVARDWRARVRRARRVGLRLPAGTYHELRYEDLVSEPVVTLRLLCKALDIHFDPAMLDHRRSAAAVLRATGRPHENRYLAGPLRPLLRDWRRDLPPAAVDRFEALAGDLLADLGYELRNERRHSVRRLTARLRRT